jgi:putative heme-binding domain-containing protein
MTSSFRRGYDGWLYANHGFHNDSVLTASDGSSIKLNSGNTYRVKIDGSHIEQFTWGRVNPFGLIFDPLGNVFSADCETLPIYQLLRGGYYPSFGKPDDGLGFAPPMMDHKHGSTAIAGIVYYAATNFPSAFRSNIFVGNVMTCRIDRDSLEEHGSTWLAQEKPDFLVSDDPWFRPVDMQQGADGAIYVADFYNRIIGHYEVPLDHPGRDRERGRIWRIVYRGTHSPAKIEPPQHFNLAHDSTRKLIEQLGNENLTIRMLAMNELTDRIGPSCTNAVAKMMSGRKANLWQKIHGMWVLYRFNALDPKIIEAAAHDKDRALRAHAMRVLSETTPLTESQRALVLTALSDPDGLVQRCAADALGRHPQLENIRPLLDAREWAPSEDTHLVHVIRMALRDQLLAAANFARLPLTQWSKLDDENVTDVALGVPTTESAKFLLQHLRNYPENREISANDLRHIARYLPEAETGDLVDYVRRQFNDDLDFQLTLFRSIEQGTAQRGDKADEHLREWGADIAKRLANSLEKDEQAWHNTPLEGSAATANPWALQMRASADDDKASPFLSSLPGGEQLTGVLRSTTFEAPAKLTFWLAGHNGFPDVADQKKNSVRLRAADTGEILAESFPPRHDVAHRYEWNLSAPGERHQKVYIEVTDGDNAGAYAWLAFGRLEPKVVPWPITDPRSTGQRQTDVADLVREYKVADIEPQLVNWLKDANTEAVAREAAARALMAIDPEPNIPIISAVGADSAEPPALREKMAGALASANSPAARAALVESLRSAPDKLQVKMALALAGSEEGADALLQLAENGKVSPRLLLDRAIKERLVAAKPAHSEERVAKLTKGLSPASADLQKVLDARLAQFDLAKSDAVKGAKVFSQNCMVCHSVDNQGGAVGPHLDGVGLRGAERLIEDILDPSRNVDPAFRYNIVTLKNGDVIAGLQRREEGAVIVFVDATGKEVPVAKTDIEKNVQSSLSLMPDNFSEAIPVPDFNNLLAFLLSKGSAPTTTAKK